MRLKRLGLFCTLAAATLYFFSACESAEEIAYIHDAPRDAKEGLSGTFSNGIQPNDQLYIYVESEEAGAAIPFNQETNKVAVKDGAVLNSTNGAVKVQGYLVNQSGSITFPVLGELSIQGLTHHQLADMIKKRLIDEGHLTNPVVTVKLMNFKVCILGDVARPGQIVVDGERITIFEALSRVGDLTIYGQRQNVTIIREENGVRTIGEVDLSSKDIFQSPYYYLHQNDVVYVEPNMRKKKNAERDPMTMTYVSSAVSIISVLSTVVYQLILAKYYYNK
ncbi:MAG: polysaccharide biosynthesis/export family protein [Bacteroidales bacterium]|nr:polysaccharide biosynthesis/export family protein [Bacteroidales bacterium]